MTEQDTDSLVVGYWQHLHWLKQTLFGLYAGEQLEKKTVLRGNGWTWGYRLVVDGRWATGASIGEDEIRLFFEMPPLLEAKHSYVIGVAFGLSFFNLALAKRDNLVYGLDNYSEGAATEYAKALVQRLQRQVPNARLHVGSSPEDVHECLADLGREKLSLVFIDGLHEDSAAAADYEALRPYLDPKSVVLWHNTDAVRATFTRCFDSSLFDRRYVLRTFGILGVYFNSEAHPLLETYLRDNCLIWHDWEANLARLVRRNDVSARPGPYLRAVGRALRSRVFR